MDENVHAGHRARLRERFLREGLDGFSEHEVLELLLIYAIPQRDVNPLAHALIARFGSLAGVLEADAAELRQVSGVGENAAVLLSLMPALLGIYSPDPKVVAAGMIRLRIIASTYALCGLMDVFCGIMRGMGAAVVPMLVSILGACAFRIFWIYAILPLHSTLGMLYISYPASWILTGSVHLICCFALLRRYPIRPCEEEET